MPDFCVKPSTLYLVGTPIGNMGDITMRALETLRQVSLIACEDTRHSLGLLNFYGISKPLTACHRHNERESAERICARLAAGDSVALITDAGMPAISDPGAIVVAQARAAGYRVEVVPGPSAVVSAIALCALEQPMWTFVGFLPSRKRDRQALLSSLSDAPGALVFYCAVHDVRDDLRDMHAAFGARQAHVVRELTKLYETHVQGELGALELDDPRGEYVVVIEAAETKPSAPQGSYCEQVAALMDGGTDKKSAIKEIARRNGVPKDVVYKAVAESDL